MAINWHLPWEFSTCILFILPLVFELFPYRSELLCGKISPPVLLIANTVKFVTSLFSFVYHDLKNSGDFDFS